MTFPFKETQYNISRYPQSGHHSLRPWSAADEHILAYIEMHNIQARSTAIFHDRFGFLGCCLQAYHPLSILYSKSQEKAYKANLATNKLSVSDADEQLVTPLAPLPLGIDLALIKVPKSLDLFRLYLYQLSQSLAEEGVVICGFMTRHFSKQLLEIAGEFFEEVTQSKAWKKSRLLILKQKKVVKELSLIHHVKLNEDRNFQQYFGVFSAKNIDYGSQFLLQHVQLRDEDHRMLDLAAGNGVLAAGLRAQHPHCELHLLEDDWLALESSKLNLKEENTFFHYDNNLESFEDHFFDFVISNPPFHFEHEIDISIALGLFQEVKRCLKSDGHFQLVASGHLNFKTHLVKLFKQVEILAENKKFVVYDCCH